MQKIFKWAAASALVAIPFIIYSFPSKKNHLPGEDEIIKSQSSSFHFASAPLPSKQKIQVAVLLDVSNSMDGLIDQAKAQLWNMVDVLGKAECQGGSPELQIALYEYGRSTNDLRKGYVKQVNGFTSDLDEVSKNLFSLTTDGGDEYCGQVIYTSLNELNWDTSAGNYKVIFIAGNEDFLQGSVHYKKACAQAGEKGVVVNTIYCGSRADAIRENWNLGAACGEGSFTIIDHNAEEEEIPTPFDAELLTLNTGLNNTYLNFNHSSADRKSKLEEVDRMNESHKTSSAVKRIQVKGNSKVYNNAEWDLVDAYAADSTVIRKLESRYLPDSLKNSSPQQLKAIVRMKASERNNIQKRIAHLSMERDRYIKAEKARRSSTNPQTLESEIEKILKQQVKRYQMQIP